MDKINKKKQYIAYLINFVVALIIYAVFYTLQKTGVINNYYSGLWILVIINSILTVSLNLATGILGELCLGHAGFMAIGAYTAALFTKNAGISLAIAFPLGIALAFVVSCFAGVVIGIPALRLVGDYLAIITLAFGQIISIIIRSFKFTGGAKGLSGIPLETNFSIAYWLLIITIAIIYALIHSRQGRAIVAIREDSIAAVSSGINVFRYKILAFSVASGLAGVAGALFAHFQGLLAPEKFGYNYSIDVMVMVVFGGMGSITGSIVSAIVLTFLPELLRDFAQFRMFIYAILLILLMIFRPQGLLGNKEISQAFFKRVFKGKASNSDSKKAGV